MNQLEKLTVTMGTVNKVFDALLTDKKVVAYDALNRELFTAQVQENQRLEAEAKIRADAIAKTKAAETGRKKK